MYQFIQLLGLIRKKELINTNTIKKSEKLLDEAGWKVGSDGIREKMVKN